MLRALRTINKAADLTKNITVKGISLTILDKTLVKAVN